MSDWLLNTILSSYYNPLALALSLGFKLFFLFLETFKPYSYTNVLNYHISIITAVLEKKLKIKNSLSLSNNGSLLRYRRDRYFLCIKNCLAPTDTIRILHCFTPHTLPKPLQLACNTWQQVFPSWLLWLVLQHRCTTLLLYLDLFLSNSPRQGT